MAWWGKPAPTLRERELADLVRLYEQVQARAFDAEAVRRLVGAVFDVVDPLLRAPMVEALDGLIAQEQLAGSRPDFPSLDLRQQLALKNKLRAMELKLEGDEAADLLIGVFGSLLPELPKVRAPSPFTVPLFNTLQNPGEWVSRLYKTLHDERYQDRDILAALRERMYLNLCFASDITPYTNTTKRFKHAYASDLPLDEVRETYLSGTPLAKLFATPVPLKLTRDDRMNHMHVIGGTGAGKTTLIENLLLHDLQSDDPPSIVLIDPHGDLIRKLTQADLGIEDRLIVMDPRDIRYPPALNVFALNQARLAGYDEATREQVTAGVIQTFDYLFTGLLGADLTAKQGVLFRYIARLMLALPEAMGRNATILDMMRLMTDAEPYMAAINSLPDIPRDFFLKDFKERTFAQTKEQIRYRLQAIVENPTMARLFTAPETKIDLYEELNRGSIILVDTAADFLKGASSNFGRIFVSLTLQAILERAAQPAERRKDTFLIVDEAASYFDSNIDDFLTETRKYRCGVVLSHQYLDQASHALRASIAANTGAKFASGISSADARALAPDMRTTPDFITSQPRLQFAAHIRNVTPHAVSIPVKTGVFDDFPRLRANALEELRERNRAKVSLGPQEPRRPVAAAPIAEPAPVSPAPPEDISSEW